MMRAILAIVEGKSEEKSVPVLLRRVLHERMQVFDVQVPRPFRVGRGKVVKTGELERAVKQGLRTRSNVAGVLVIMDADEDCPAELAPQLLSRARNQTHLPVSVVLAKREFEAWFMGCLEAYRGFQTIPTDAVAPKNAEDDDAKGALQKITRLDKYRTATDQVKFVERLDFDLCSKRCPSFAKLLRDVEELVHAMAAP
jgi:hypothetical protein